MIHIPSPPLAIITVTLCHFIYHHFLDLSLSLACIHFVHRVGIGKTLGAPVAGSGLIEVCLTCFCFGIFLGTENKIYIHRQLDQRGREEQKKDVVILILYSHCPEGARCWDDLHETRGSV